MRVIEIPELEFTNWVKWENRGNIPNNQFPGVYIIGITNECLEGCQPKWHEVSYIGMTNSRGGLRSRWRQFDRSIHGKTGHSGGNTIYNTLGDYKFWSLNMFVAAMIVVCNPSNPSREDYLKMGNVAFYEYEAFAKYYDVVGGHPKYNKK
jgi:hypothetical protein